MKEFKEYRTLNETALAKKAYNAAKDKVKGNVHSAVDCAKNPKACARKGAGVVKGMHQDLGGGAKGAAALGATAAVGATVPGGAILAPLMYQGAKKLLGKKKFKEWLELREDTQSDRAVARHFNADWEKHPCEECGEQARSRSRGITGAGNEEWETECDNQNCPRYKRGQQLSDHI